jgi:hypothetical protein
MWETLKISLNSLLLMLKVYISDFLWPRVWVSRSPMERNVSMCLITPRGDVEVFLAMVAMSGQQAPSSEALSASAKATNFSPDGMARDHTLAMIRILIEKKKPPGRTHRQRPQTARGMDLAAKMVLL